MLGGGGGGGGSSSLDVGRTKRRRGETGERERGRERGSQRGDGRATSRRAGGVTSTDITRGREGGWRQEGGITLRAVDERRETTGTGGETRLGGTNT